MEHVQGEWQLEMIFHTSSYTCSSPTSTRTGGSLHPEKRTRATTTFRWKIAIRSWVKKLELESQLVAGIIFIFNRVVAFRKMARTTTRRMARWAMPSTLLQGSCTFEVSRTDIGECRARDGRWRQHTSSHAQNARHSRKFFSCTRNQRTCVGSRPDGQGHVDCLSPRAHPKSFIRPMFHGTLLESQFSSPSPFSSFCSSQLPAQTSLLNASISQKPCATLQGRLILGWLAEQSPPTGYEPKSPIEVSSEHTPIDFPSRKDSFDTDFNDPSTTVAAPEIGDTMEVGQLTSPLFSQSANPSGVSGSQQQGAASSSKQQQAAASSSKQQQASSSVVNPWQDTDLRSTEKLARGVESFSSFEKPLLKGRRDRELESVQLSQIEKERILSEQKSLHEYLEKEAESAFQG